MGGSATQPRAIMLQGTGSDVGKSLLVAGLCRAFARRGLSVRPFKPQNMSNNAAVTDDGGEIGRAQALQARAANVAPSRHMNPVLLKPQTDVGAQVVVQGRVMQNAGARDYHALKPQLMAAVLDSFRALAAGADLVIVEGAGSPAEVNLRAGDIANMGFAAAAGVPVVLVGDVDRGGVIASIVGTQALLDEADRARVQGFVINKFRGDVSLFDDALATITRRSGLASFGVVPFFEAAHRLPAEDAASLDGRGFEGAAVDDPIRIIVPRLARIANFDDLDPLAAEADVAVELVEPGRALPGNADVIILPGTKATIADMAFLREQGWDIDIAAHVRRGGRVVGLCGGYQMLGTAIADPDGIEGAAGTTAGLGLLDVATVIAGAKTLRAAQGSEASSGAPVRGYEMHMGETTGADAARPWLRLNGGDAGAVDESGRVMGAYLHGIFADDEFRARFLGRLRAARAGGVAYDAMVERTLDQLADHLETHLDMDDLLALAAPIKV